MRFRVNGSRPAAMQHQSFQLLQMEKKLFSLAAQNAPQFAEICVAPQARISATVLIGDVSVEIH